MRAPKRKPGPLANERGHTLVELLVVAIMLLITFGVATYLLQIGVRTQPRISERAYALQEGRTLMERLTRELRLSYAVRVATPSEIAFLTFVRRQACGTGTDATASVAIPCQVGYRCQAGACERRESAPGSTLAAGGVRLVSGLSSDSVFTYEPDSDEPASVGLRFEFPASGSEDAVTLSDGVNLRNALR